MIYCKETAVSAIRRINIDTCYSSNLPEFSIRSCVHNVAYIWIPNSCVQLNFIVTGSWRPKEILDASCCCVRPTLQWMEFSTPCCWDLNRCHAIFGQGDYIHETTSNMGRNEPRIVDRSSSSSSRLYHVVSSASFQGHMAWHRGSSWVLRTSSAWAASKRCIQLCCTELLARRLPWRLGLAAANPGPRIWRPNWGFQTPSSALLLDS